MNLPHLIKFWLFFPSVKSQSMFLQYYLVTHLDCLTFLFADEHKWLASGYFLHTPLNTKNTARSHFEHVFKLFFGKLLATQPRQTIVCEGLNAIRWRSLKGAVGNAPAQAQKRGVRFSLWCCSGHLFNWLLKYY